MLDTGKSFSSRRSSSLKNWMKPFMSEFTSNYRKNIVQCFEVDEDDLATGHKRWTKFFGRTVKNRRVSVHVSVHVAWSSTWGPMFQGNKLSHPLSSCWSHRWRVEKRFDSLWFLFRWTSDSQSDLLSARWEVRFSLTPKIQSASPCS